MKLVTKIWWRDKYRKVDPEKAPVETRQLDSFLVYNGACKCFFKGQGGWYKINKEGQFQYVTRTLYLLSLKDWLKIAKDDYYIPNLAGII